MAQKKTFVTYIGNYLINLMFVVALVCSIEFVAQAEGALQLKAEIEGYQQVLLQWESDNQETLFEVYKSTDGGTSYQMLATLPGQTGSIKCYDIDVKMGETYFYKLVQRISEEEKRESSPVCAKVVLAAPTNVTAKVVKKNRIQITWSKVKKAHNYTVYRSEDKGKSFEKLGTSKQNSYTDYDVKKGCTYYYTVVANHKRYTAWKSIRSDVVSAHLKMAAPVVIGSFNEDKIKLTWKKIKGADLYYVYKKNSDNKYELVQETKKLYYVDCNVNKDNTYVYKVVAVEKTDDAVIKGETSAPYKIKAVSIDPNKKMVALTYDDGPGKYTKDIVKCLKENQAKATFYVIGRNINSYKDAMKAADKIGCEIGNHTYNHPKLTKLSEDDVRKEIESTDKKIKKVIGEKAVTMRPPGGSYNAMVQKAVGKPIIMWSVDTRDWEHRDSDRIIRIVMDNVQDGDIILMHDIHEATKKASMTLIPKLRREGYQLVTVSELAQYRGYPLEEGKVYSNLRKKNSGKK